MSSSREGIKEVEILLPDGTSERARFTLDFTGAHTGLITLTVACVGREITKKAGDFFEALCLIRKELDPEGLRLNCYGASRNVWASGMQRDMALGNVAYRMVEDRPVDQRDLVSIWDTGPDVQPATVEEQTQNWTHRLAERERQAHELQTHGQGRPSEGLIGYDTKVYGRSAPERDPEDLDQEIAKHTSRLEANSNDGKAYFNRAALRQAKKEHQGAIADASQAIECGLKDRGVYTVRGQSSLEVGDAGGAIRDFEEAAFYEPGSPSAWFNLGRACEKVGDVERAAWAYGRAIATGPSEGAHFNRGILRVRNYDLLESIEDFSQVLEINSRNVPGYINRAHLRMHTGDLRGAIEDHSRAIELEPDQPEGYLRRALAFLVVGDVRGAFLDSTRGVELAPEEARGYCLRGAARIKEGDYPGAIEDCTRAIGIRGDYPAAYSCRGEAKAEIGDVPGAVNDFTKALELNPHDLNVFLSRGDAYDEMGRHDLALRDYESVLRVAHPSWSLRAKVESWVRDYRATGPILQERSPSTESSAQMVMAPDFPPLPECECGTQLAPMEDRVRFQCSGCGALFGADRTDLMPPSLVPLAISKGGRSYRRLDVHKVDWKYSQDDLGRIRQGVVPSSMDDKWLIFARRNDVFIVRSYRQSLFYVARLTDIGIDQVQVAHDLSDAIRDVELVRWIVERVLLGREWPLPSRVDDFIGSRAGFRGALLGLAAGDALGTTLEFQPAGTFDPIQDMRGGGPFHLKPGEWTDDMSMALCLGESLVECKGFEPVDQLERYLRWYRSGHLSSNGSCFDIGNTVRAALTRFEESHEAYCGPDHPRSAGNGSIMRLAPVALAYVRRPREAIERCGESSRTTHGALEAIDGCRYLGALLVGALRGVPKDELLSTRFTPVPGYWEERPLAPAIDEIACGSFKSRQPPMIQGTGYVVRSLEAALWAFYRSGSFREGALCAVNLGDDADTTGAVYGQLAGAFYGDQGIPEEWRRRLAHRPLIESTADRLLELSQALGDPPA